MDTNQDRDDKEYNSEQKTDKSSKNSKCLAIPFPCSIQDAEKRIHDQESLSSIFSPKIERTFVRNDIQSSVKNAKDIYESPISRKLKISPEGLSKTKPKIETVRASMSSIKQSKGDLDIESEVKIKRTVFKDYKECVKLPSDRQNNREVIKRGCLYTNNIDTNDNAHIDKPKSKPAPKRIIKKIAESLDAWQATKRLKNSRNSNLGIV